MKYNETLLIGLALVAALVFSKSGSASSIFKKSSVPFLPLENKTISFMENFPYLEKFKQIFPIKETNVQLYNIQDIEQKQKNERINYLQNEQKMVQQYIGSQKNPYSPNAAFGKIAPKNWGGINLLEKFEKTFKHMKKVWSGEKGPLSGVSVFPDFRLFLNEENYNIIKSQAKYEEAEKIVQTNIGKANEYAIRQQGDIDNINTEYQTRFGNLSRYG
jgi:hypothetical protein